MTGRLGYRVPVERRLENIVVMPDGCWHWQGTILNDGYGQLVTGGVHWLAHRFFYTQLVGEIPEGKVLDHTCHNDSDCVAGRDCLHRRCVNPQHLDPTTTKINTNRGRRANSLKTHCPQDHEYTEETTYITTQGHRLCRLCAKARKLIYRAEPGYKELDARRHREARARKVEDARISQH